VASLVHDGSSVRFAASEDKTVCEVKAFPKCQLPVRLAPMSTQILCRCALLGLMLGGCIQRTAAPPSSPASDTPQASALLEAANARIANVPRVDLLCGRGLRDFVVQGEAQKIESSQISVAWPTLWRGHPPSVKQGSGLEYAVQFQAPTCAAVEAGDILLATFYLRAEVPKDDGVGETSFVFELGKPPTPSPWNTRSRPWPNGPRCKSASHPWRPMRLGRRT